MTDPKSAIDAALSPATQIDDITVKPITLARYALLELIQSPFVTLENKINPIAFIPTIFVCCADIADLSKYDSNNIDDLKTAAFEYADKLEPQLLSKLISELDIRIKQLLKVTPQIPQDENIKKKEI